VICYYKLSPDSDSEIIFENWLIFGKVMAYKKMVPIVLGHPVV